jgi:hypothetical protein
VKPLAKVLGVARSNLIEQLKPATGKRSGGGPRPDDAWLLPLIRAIVAERASYGYRRVTALLNRQLSAQGRGGVNHKRIYRIMHLERLSLCNATCGSGSWTRPRINGVPALLSEDQLGVMLNAIERVKLLKLLWDAVGSEFGD